MALIREEVASIEQNGITKVAFPRLHESDIIPLWFGEGDASTPEFICNTAIDDLSRGDTFYTHTRGREELREAIRRYLNNLYKVDLHPDRISVAGSAMMGMTIALQMALTTGSHGLIVGPAWPNVYNSMRVTGADISYLRLELKDGYWSLDMDVLRAALRPETKVVFVNSPNNPTGWIMAGEQQEELLAIAREREILIISDEVYQRLVYDADASPSFLSIADDEDPVVCIGGFSKSWAMTGWRLGWMVAPARYENLITSLSECFNTGSTVFTQGAGIVALEQGEAWVAELKTRYARGRELLVEILGSHPALQMSVPEGAFYAFPHVPGLKDSLALCEALADEARVGVAPGDGFGPGNEAFFRICFAQSEERLIEGLNRIKGFLDGPRLKDFLE